MKRKTTHWMGLLLALAFAAAILVGGAIAPAHGASPAWDLEAGYQLSPVAAPYVGARVNLEVADLWLAQLWLLPEAGVTLTSPAEWYGRVQLLADTGLATVGAEVKTGGDTDAVVKVFLRFGL